METADDFWLEHPDPTDDELADLCRAWARYEREMRDERSEDPLPKSDEAVTGGPGGILPAGKRGNESDKADHPLWWAAEGVMDAVGNLHRLWRVICCLCQVVDPDDDWVIGMIGVGPIESAFFTFGEEAMDLIEPAADRDSVLLTALESVWCWDEPVRPRIDALLERHGRGRPR